jgi:hypothetical protein
MNNIHVCIYIYGLLGQNSWFWHVFPRLGISDLISCALKSVAANRFALSLSLYTYIYIHIYTYIYMWGELFPCLAMFIVYYYDIPIIWMNEASYFHPWPPFWWRSRKPLGGGSLLVVGDVLLASGSQWNLWHGGWSCQWSCWSPILIAFLLVLVTRLTMDVYGK